MFRFRPYRFITVLSVAALAVGVPRGISMLKAFWHQGQDALIENLPTNTLQRMAADAVNARVAQRVDFETRIDQHAEDARRLGREIDKARRTRDEIAGDLKREQDALDARQKAAFVMIDGQQFSRGEVAADVNSRQLALTRLDEQIQSMSETLAAEQAAVQDGRATAQRAATDEDGQRDAIALAAMQEQTAELQLDAAKTAAAMTPALAGDAAAVNQPLLEIQRRAKLAAAQARAINRQAGRFPVNQFAVPSSALRAGAAEADAK